MTHRIRRKLGFLGIDKPLYVTLPEGTPKPTIRASEAVVDKLVGDFQVEVLRGLIEGRVSIAELVDLDRKGQLSGAGILASTVLSRNLWTEWERIAPQMGRAFQTRRRYETSRKALQKRAGSRLQAVRDLRDMEWSTLRSEWLVGRSGADWNHLRRAISRFLTLLLGHETHPFRIEVVGMMEPAPESKRVPDLTVEVWEKIVDFIPAEIRPAFYVIALHGLRVGEYLSLTPERLRPATLQLMVTGKTNQTPVPVPVVEGAWPLVEQAVPSPLQYKALRKCWMDACKKAGVSGIRIHDLRHFAAQLADNAGASLVATQSLLRHASVNQTADYAKQREARGAVERVFQAIGPKVKIG